MPSLPSALGSLPLAQQVLPQQQQRVRPLVCRQP
jgi:hypothetical protein